MNNEKQTIPDLQVKLIGKKNPIKVIYGVLQWPEWNGYLQENVGFSKRQKRPSTGYIEITVEGGVNPDGSLDTSPEQVNAYWYLIDHTQKMKSVVLEGLVHHFPRLLADDYEYYDVEEGGFPPISEIVPGYNFKAFIRLDSIDIMDIVKEDSAYVNWVFSCTWDEEHGFQIITHKDRIIDIGQEYDLWEIEKDNGTYDENEAAYKPMAGPAPYSWKKKWWQFWKKY